MNHVDHRANVKDCLELIRRDVNVLDTLEVLYNLGGLGALGRCCLILG